MEENTRTAWVYQIRNGINGKVYIGSTVNVGRRIEAHYGSLRRGKHINIKLQRAYNKYGEENLLFEILEETTEDNKFIVEQKYLDNIKPFGENGYNIMEYTFGQYYPPQRNGNQKIDIEDVLLIKQLISQGKHPNEVSKELNITLNIVTNIQQGKSFLNIGEEYNDQVLNYFRYKFDKAEDMYLNNYDIEEISKEVGLPNNTITRELNKRNVTSRIVYKICSKCGCYIYKKQKALNMCEKCRTKKCGICGEKIIVKKHNQKYCKKCAKIADREKAKLRTSNKMQK